MNPNPLHIGIAGLGTVGGGTLRILHQNASLIADRCGRELKVVAVSARDRARNRGVSLDGIAWYDDPVALAADSKTQVVVELIGGAEGPARNLVTAALKAGKSVVTANKALIATHGLELAAIAESTGAMLAFEAGVAGGIPIIKALRDGLAANRFERIVGILNGTCNFILSTMWERKCSFEEALKEAQKLGFAEADPTLDVSGGDTAHKLAILTSLAYGCKVNIEGVTVEGIQDITLRDMDFAHELGYTIKLLGIARQTDKGIEQRVHPCMVPILSPLGSVDGGNNAVVTEGDAVGRSIFEGLGAGAGPTASSVVADIIDIARGVHYHAFTLPVRRLKDLPVSPVAGLTSHYYLRLSVIDRPGVLAEVTGIFRDEGISMRSFLQHSHQPEESVQLVLTTHETLEASMQKALKKIAALKTMTGPPHLIRIEHI